MGGPFERRTDAERCYWVPGAGGLSHALGDDADLLDAGAFGGVDDLDDVAVAQVGRAVDEHRLVLALLEDRPETLLELADGDVLLVDRDLLVGGVVEHDLRDVGLRLIAASSFPPAG